MGRVQMDPVKIALPSGRIQNNFFRLLREAGIEVSSSDRSYRPSVSLPGFDAKIFKPQNIVEMLALGKRDIGVVGYDWVVEFNADIVELLDTKLDPVKIVAASNYTSLSDLMSSRSEIVVASEYTSISARWMKQNEICGRVIRSFGTTEAFPPEDADCIIDNTATGATLSACNLTIIDEIICSSTRVFANPKALENQSSRGRIEDFLLLLRSVLDARERVMIEINVGSEFLEQVASILPCMKTPTISELYSGAGFVVKAAVLRGNLPRLIPEIKLRGGTDIVVSSLSNVVP